MSRRLWHLPAALKRRRRLPAAPPVGAPCASAQNGRKRADGGPRAPFRGGNDLRDTPLFLQWLGCVSENVAVPLECLKRPSNGSFVDRSFVSLPLEGSSRKSNNLRDTTQWLHFFFVFRLDSARRPPQIDLRTTSIAALPELAALRSRPLPRDRNPTTGSSIALGARIEPGSVFRYADPLPGG